MQLGGKLKKLRKEKDLSQQQLADLVGVHVTHISRIETDRFTPSLELLKKLAILLSVSTDYLLYDEVTDLEQNKFKDKSLYEKMKLVDNLEDTDRAIIHGVIDSFLTKQQMWKVLSKPNIKQKEEVFL